MRAVTVAAARERAAAAVVRQRRDWAAFGGEQALLELPLHPPTEREALADSASAIAWATAWRGTAGAVWETRNWSRIGRQEVPVRLVLNGAESIAAFAGRTAEREWRVLRERASRLLQQFDASDPLRDAIRSVGLALLKLEADDFEMAQQVLGWLREHPVHDYRIRQVPVPGMHTKWLGSHRKLIEVLHSAISGRQSLGLIEGAHRVRVRFLDPALRPGGLDDVTVPVEQLAAMQVRASAVLILENLETLLALPPLFGVIAVHGSGYAVVDTVPRLPWARAGKLLYWGDLDAEGFGILHALRARGIRVQSMLMSEAEYTTFRSLAVVDPKFSGGKILSQLTAGEQRVYQQIVAARGARLEQERLPWPYVLEQLRRFLP